MSWETRERGGRYYTRSRRVNGQVVREYIGTGFVAEMASELDRLDRERREQERIERRLAMIETEEREAPIKALHDDIEMIARGALLAGGYHRHHGQWRRKRG
jgi:hypothetical protein